MGELEIVMYVGFLLAAYSVVGNDVIQTLGTFLSSNEHRPWWVLSLFASSILVVVLVYGWYVNDGDVTYGRLIGDPMTNGFENPKYKNPDDIKGFGWPFLIPPLILLTITRFGIPVSTSFLILTFFNPKNLYDMVVKSMSGYLVAFVAALLIYFLIAKKFEKRFAESTPTEKEIKWWSIAQWISTGFLWSQWLIQDFANIYVYLPRQIELPTLIATVSIFVILLSYIFYTKGGAIQSIVKAKTNTVDVRSATLIDLAYGFVLLFFKELNNVPMSTTWVFLGLLAGREIGIKYFAYGGVKNPTLIDLGKDLLKVFFGLAVSIGLVFLIRYLTV
ncbi:MAG: hypothetical protein RH948_19290 [Cyclobacteriaceae bacterium]